MSDPAAPSDPAASAGSRSPSRGAALLGLMEPLLADAAGEGASAVSLQVDIAADPGDAALALTARVERATRTLVFATAEARMADGRLAATCTAVFKRS